MWFAQQTLWDIFNKFERKPDYAAAEELLDEVKKRQDVITRVAQQFRMQGKREFADALEHHLRNRLASIGGYVSLFLKGANSATETISVIKVCSIIKEEIIAYEKAFASFDEHLKKHIALAQAEMRKEYELCELERTAA
ncbi:hypothetical protein HY491_04060 [Candidatus Woesearchaeota archaeon]|nr:hypothetical protein [Candidatus Woesearchaeota archaeon]